MSNPRFISVQPEWRKPGMASAFTLIELLVVIAIFKLKFPALVAATGGIFKYDTYGREVPDTFNMCVDYPEKLSVVLVCTLANEYPTEPCIRGDEGAITLQNPVWEGGFDTVTIIPNKGERKVVPGEKPNSGLAHWKNFLECVRSQTQPVSGVESGYHVQTALNMAMLSWLHKKVARFDLEKEEILL